MATSHDRSLRGWIKACWLGYFTLFSAFLVTGLLTTLFWPATWPPMLDFSSIDPAALPDSIDPVLYRRIYRINLGYHVVHLAGFGGLLGALQASTLGRSRRVWAGLSALGFASLLLLEAIRPGLVAGGHPAPVEPILIAVGGGSLAGLLQWAYMRRGGIAAGRWLSRWIGGLVAGVVAAAALLTVLGPLLRPVVRAMFADDEIFVFVGEVIFFTVYGSVVGLVAGWVSRGPARELLRSGDRPGFGN